MHGHRLVGVRTCRRSCDNASTVCAAAEGCWHRWHSCFWMRAYASADKPPRRLAPRLAAVSMLAMPPEEAERDMLEEASLQRVSRARHLQKHVHPHKATPGDANAAFKMGAMMRALAMATDPATPPCHGSGRQTRCAAWRRVLAQVGQLPRPFERRAHRGRRFAALRSTLAHPASRHAKMSSTSCCASMGRFSMRAS